MKARAVKEGLKHIKKCGDFLEAIKETKNEKEIKQKFRELLVKTNCVKENDELANELMNLVINI